MAVGHLIILYVQHINFEGRGMILPLSGPILYYYDIVEEISGNCILGGSTYIILYYPTWTTLDVDMILLQELMASREWLRS